MMRAVFFDIDGTLLRMHGAGRRAFSAAIRDVYGWDDDLSHINFAGATDLDVLHRIIMKHGGVPEKASTTRFFEAFPRRLEDFAKTSRCDVYPGVQELVDLLAGREDIMVGLITGNIEACAHIKLACAGLHGRFVIGAYGHEHADRNEIAMLARKRMTDALPNGQRFEKIILIGDTPSDIRAAHAISAGAIAVATGHYSIDDLLQANADLAVDSLEDPRVMEMILG